MRPNDFASYLLAIGICNLLLYFAFYIIMKVNGKREQLLCFTGPEQGAGRKEAFHISTPVRFGWLGGLGLL